jgi:hypothetical protein
MVYVRTLAFRRNSGPQFAPFNTGERDVLPH